MTAKDKVRELSREIEAVLKEKFGDRVSMLGGKFSDMHAELKISVVLSDKPEAAADALRESFNRIAPFLGLKESDFDLPLIVNGHPATLTRVEPGRGKYPFVATIKATGKAYKVTPDTFLLARARAGVSVPA